MIAGHDNYNNSGGSPFSSNSSGGGPWGLLAAGIQDTMSIGWNIAEWIYKHNEQRRAEHRSDTAVQRYAADLEAAGLSKTLAAGGQSHTVEPIRSLGAPDVKGADAVMQSMALEMAYKELESRIRYTEALTSKVGAETDLLGKTGSEIDARIGSILSNTEQTNIENKNLEERLKAQLQQIITETKYTEGKIKMTAQEIQQSKAIVHKLQQEERHIQAQIELDYQRNRQIEVQRGRERLAMIKEQQENWHKLMSGNMDKSFLGKIATDIISPITGWNYNSEFARQYYEEFSKISREILSH